MSFSIAGQALKISSAEDMLPHIDAIAKLDKCTSIDLSGNTIGIEASRALAACISNNAHVRDNLADANLADLYTSRLVDEVVESLQLILPALLKCPQLHTVNLSDNAFGLRTIDSLEHFISRAAPLKHLILSNNGMGPFAGERIGKALFHLAEYKKQQGADKAPPLETFVCGRNRLENGSSLYLALGLKAHGAGLRTVRLYQNGIRPRGIMNLLHYGLRFNTGLRVLDVQDNTLTATASAMLAETLPVWKDVLEELNLNDCLLKRQGADDVLKVFVDMEFPKLHALKLEFNEICQASVEEKLLVAIEAKHLPALKTLQINGNVLEEDSEALDTLQGMFDDLELDDLEEPDSDEEDEEDDDEDDEDEAFLEVETDPLEKELLQVDIDQLASDLAKTAI